MSSERKVRERSQYGHIKGFVAVPKIGTAHNYLARLVPLFSRLRKCLYIERHLRDGEEMGRKIRTVKDGFQCSVP